MTAPKRNPRKSRAHPKQPPMFPVAYVKYHDHCWLEARDLEKIEVAKPFVVEETGFLLVERDDYVTLAKERSTDGEKGKVQYDSVTIIMRSDILHFELMGTPAAPALKAAKPKSAAKAKAKKAAKAPAKRAKK